VSLVHDDDDVPCCCSDPCPPPPSLWCPCPCRPPEKTTSASTEPGGEDSAEAAARRKIDYCLGSSVTRRCGPSWGLGNLSVPPLITPLYQG
jgi:hypothetical protein